MEYRTIKWNRDELYEQIWTRPLRTVAKEYGLSDVGLAKVCARLQIPRPGVGYWRRKERGFTVSRPELPVIKEVLKMVTRVRLPPPPKPEMGSEPLVALRVPEVKTAVHPLARQSAKAFADGHADQFGRLRSSDWRLPHLDLRVTRAGLERALSFMDMFIKLLEANGMSVSVATVNEPAATTVHVDGEQVKVVLKERVRGRKRALTAREQRDHERWPEVYRSTFRWVYDPTNQFVFEILSYSDRQCVWTDSKGNAIEQCLEQIASGILAAGVWAKRFRAEHDAAQVQAKNDEVVRLRERARVEKLKHDVARWEEAQRVRGYLAAVRKRAELQEGGLSKASPVSRFLAWAHRYADNLDPTGTAPGPDWNDPEL